MKPNKLFRKNDTHSIASPRNGKALIWQTKTQRGILDLASHSGRCHYDYAKKRQERRYETETRQYWERSRSRNRRDRNSPLLANSSKNYSRKKEGLDGYNSEYAVRQRVRSLSRVRADPVRGRSKSPRKPGEPGPGILKGRSKSAHFGRSKNVSVSEWTYKAVRINRVDQVKYFRASSDEEFMPPVDAVGNADSIDESVLNKQNCGNEENMNKKFEENMFNVEVASEEISMKEVQNQNDTGVTSEIPQQIVDINMREDENANYLSAGRSNKNLLNDSSNFEMQGNSTTNSLGDFYCGEIVCQKEDCPNTALTSTLGLFLSTKSGHAWLCSQHTKCLLCEKEVKDEDSIMCVSCGRVFHSDHLPDQFYDNTLNNKFICMLCSNPEQFTPSEKTHSCAFEEVLGSGDLEGLQIGVEARLSNENYPKPFSGKKNSGDEDSPSINKKRSLDSSVKARKSKSAPVREIQYVDQSLPSGWSRQIVDTAHRRKRVVIVGPNARRFWSRSDLIKYFLKNENLEKVQWQAFSFSLYGP